MLMRFFLLKLAYAGPRKKKNPIIAILQVCAKRSHHCNTYCIIPDSALRRSTIWYYVDPIAMRLRRAGSEVSKQHCVKRTRNDTLRLSCAMCINDCANGYSDANEMTWTQWHESIKESMNECIHECVTHLMDESMNESSNERLNTWVNKWIR